jgi:hypothetical protein
MESSLITNQGKPKFTLPLLVEDFGGNVKSIETVPLIKIPKLTLKWPDPISEDALIGIVGKIVKFIEPETESDPMALLIQFLVVIGNIIGRNIFYSVEQTPHFSNLFITLVGKSSSARKGTSYDNIISLFDFNDDWFNKCRKSGVATGEGLIHAIRDKVASETTGENKKTGELETKIDVIDEGVTDKRLLATESEFSNVLKNSARDTNTVSNSLRQGWDSKPMANLTKNSAESVQKPHISLIGHITMMELDKFLTETDMFNGFGNRFLWILVQRSKELPFGGKLDLVELDKFKKILHDIVLHGQQYDRIDFSQAAKQLWNEGGMYKDLSQDHEGLLGAMTSRAAPQVIRIAMIYAVLDKSLEINLEHLKAARAVWEYCFQSCEYLFSHHLENPTANKILKALACTPNGLNRTEIRSLFSGHKSKNIIDEALEQLSQRNLAYCQKEKSGDSVTFGRDIEKWFLIKNAD